MVCALVLNWVWFLEELATSSSLGEETISLLMFTQLPDCVKPFKVTLKFSFKAQ